MRTTLGNMFSRPHSAMERRIGASDMPFSVMEYSTLGGGPPSSRRSTTPSASSSRSCFERILGETPPIIPRSWPNLSGPPVMRWQSMTVFHLPSMTDIVASTAQFILGGVPGMSRATLCGYIAVWRGRPRNLAHGARGGRRSLKKHYKPVRSLHSSPPPGGEGGCEGMHSVTAMLAAYALLNLVAAAMYVADKGRAIKGEWRVPESTLLAAALVGPFGAAAAMSAAHHKTRKPKFKLVYVFLALHVALFACAGLGAAGIRFGRGRSAS